MLRRLLVRAPGLLAASMLLALAACDDVDKDIGTPCEMEDDCPEPLICDVHDGQGSCQQNHDHDDEGDEVASCTADRDCDDDMICDMHDGQGWCTPPHGHDTGTSG